MVITVEINGESYRATTDYTIQQQAGAISNSNIDVLVEAGQDVPDPMSAVQIFADGVPFFFGFVQSAESPDFSTGFEVKRYRLSVQSAEVIFNNRLVSEAYENETTSNIVQDIFEKYIEPEGITLGTITDLDYTYENYNCSFTRLYDVLFELAGDVSSSFYVSADKKFYFITRESLIEYDAPEHITGLKIENQKGDLRTVQIVTGASEETSQQIEGTYWTADQVAWVLGYQVKRVVGMTINGSPVGVGVLGVDEADTSKAFLYQVGSNTITLNVNASTLPATGDNVVIVYYGYYEVLVTNTNDSLKQSIATLNGTTGLIEQVFTDTSINNFADADAKAASLLGLYNETEKSISCSLVEDGTTDLFTMWNFNKPDLGVVGQFVIVERIISSFGSDRIWSRLKLNSKNLFSRYGTVLTTSSKKKRSDVKVYKNSSFGDTILITDSAIFESAGLVYWPTDSAFSDPMIDGFYPTGE